MRKSDLGKPLTQVTFRCAACRHTFSAEPARVDDAPELEHHPYAYFGICPDCGEECAQAAWERALLKAWQAPRDPEKMARIAQNVVGHRPTHEETLRTRFNAMKHGMSAKTATYFPAKPDGYSFCATCEVDRGWCAAQPCCVKKTELFMRHQAAFEQQNPKHLMGIYSELHAAVFAVLQQILQTIVADGVKLTSPKWFTDKDGRLQLCEYIDENGALRKIMDVSAHPLFKPLGELLTRTGLSLSDMGMTMKVIDAEEQEMGRLAREGEEKETADQMRLRSVQLLESLAEKVDRAKAKTDRDPVLLEYNQESGEATPAAG